MNQTTSSHTTELNGEATNGAPVSIHAQRPGVTRISRRAVMLTAVFGASLGLVVLMTGFGGQRAATTRNGPEENAIRPSGTIETVRDLPADYSFDVRDAAKGIGYGTLTAQVGASTHRHLFVGRARQLFQFHHGCGRRGLLPQRAGRDQGASVD